MAQVSACPLSPTHTSSPATDFQVITNSHNFFYLAVFFWEFPYEQLENPNVRVESESLLTTRSRRSGGGGRIGGGRERWNGVPVKAVALRCLAPRVTFLSVTDGVDVTINDIGSEAPPIARGAGANITCLFSLRCYFSERSAITPPSTHHQPPLALSDVPLTAAELANPNP